MLFFNEVTMKKSLKTQCSHVQWLLLEEILIQWWCPVASIEALELLHRAMHAVTYPLITAAIKTASKLGVCFVVVLFDVALAAAGAIRSK
jgi:hypothetical protein